MAWPQGFGVLGDVRLVAVGDTELLQHEVDARGLLGDRMLDLQAGIHLKERDPAIGAQRNPSVPAP